MSNNQRHQQQRPKASEAVAVVGLGLSLPGAATVDEFWSNIVEARRFFQPATALDWGAEPELFYQAGGPATDKAYNVNGVFNHERAVDEEGLDLPDDFDPQSADASLAFWLNAGRRAASGVKWAKVDKSKVGVISGHVILPTTAMAEAAVSLYTAEATRGWNARPQLKAAPKDAFRVLGYSARLLARSLGFSGPAYTLDAACASSLYAVHLAAQELLSGRAEAVISGGVAKADALFTQLGFSQLRALSASGYLNSFDQSADGLVVGEGAVALVLKRLDTALAHGDQILAVIRGVGLSNDQTGNILAPQAEGQLRAMKAAWRNAGLSPASLGLIEAHGTGTILGDQVEVATLKELLADNDFPRAYSPNMAPVLGSVKSNIGHLLSAAGAAGLAKVILALRHKILPPTAGFKNEAQGLRLAEAPTLRLLKTPEAWPEPEGGQPRLAAVNAFGFGGVNAQVIVEEYLPHLWQAESPAPTAEKKPSSVRLLSARALSAPWPDFASLAQNWMDSEGPPIIATRRFGSLKATGLFFNSLVLEGANMRLAPKDLGHLLPQQALALKMTDEALAEARLEAVHGSDYITAKDAEPGAPGVHKSQVGVFMGVDIDPRSADYAFRWLGPLRAAEALVATGELRARDVPEFVKSLRDKCPPALTASRVIGALGSLVASRVARYLGSGGPAFTVSEENMSGIRALKLAIEAIGRGEIDLALVGLVDTMGDPKTAALEPRRLWEEGAVTLVLASPAAARDLGRAQAPELTELTELDGRIGGLGGLFPLVKNAFFIRHRLVSRGLGAGAAYWIKNKSDPPRSLESPGFLITEKGGEEVWSPPFSYEDATWFLVRSQNRDDSIQLLDRLEYMTIEAMKDHSLVEVLGPVRSEKRGLKRLGDQFWAQYGNASGARPALAIMAKSFDELLLQIKKAKSRLRGQETPNTQGGDKGRIIWALKGDRVRGELAWVFPGSGSHYQDLGRRLAMSFPHLIGKLEDGVERLADQFQSNVFWAQSHREASPIQAILGQVSFGLLGAEVLKQFKVLPQAVIGYSLGETTALAATGAWPDRERLYADFIKSPLFTRELAGEYLAARRFLKWPEGRGFRWITGVLPRPAGEIKKALDKLPSTYRGHAFLLLINTRGEGVVGGEESAVKALAHSLGAVMCPLDSVASVHNPVVGEVLEAYRQFHSRPTVAPQGIRFYSPAWGRAYELNSQSAADSLTEQALRGHDFTKVIEQAYQDGVRFFVEVGPGSGATRMIDSILAGRPHLAAALATGAQDEGWMGLNRLFVELWMAGYPLKKMSILYPDAESGPPQLPVEIKLAPGSEVWPEPEDILAEVTAPPIAEPPQVSRTEAAPSSNTAAPDAFGQWLEENKKTRHEEAAAARAESPAPLNRKECLEFAVGKIANVFGPRFGQADTFPSRVRLPNEPLMFVDRVLSLSGKALSMTTGAIVTEHDITKDAWYLDSGHIPTGLAIESGQADLMLSAWLGADFVTRGLALYRLLDAEVAFHRELPRVGETVRYDIRILRFFKYGQTHLFRFEFDGTVGGRPLLTMKGGCAGFFTPAELAGGRGLPGGGLTEDAPPVKLDPAAAAFRPQLPASINETALAALRRGDVAAAFGAGYRPPLKNPLTLPDGKLALFDRAVKIQSRGGRYGAGFIRTELDIDPEAWFLTSHFVGDEVMPGTLMYESCLQSLRLFLMASGWIGEAGQVDWQPLLGAAASLKCRGQVTGRTKIAAYEIHIRRLEFITPAGGGEPEPAASAEAIMLADDRPIVEVRNMNLRLAGSSQAALEALWSASTALGPVRRRVVSPPPAAADSVKVFNKARLTALAQGRPSDALGRAYARFDSGDFVARLPRAPYDLIDQAEVKNCPPYEVEVGAEVTALYTVKRDTWLLREVGGADPALPYAALNEIALQPCGFLAAYMGSALPFEGPMHFRNLGGKAAVSAQVRGGDKVETVARLTRKSRMGEMLIQHYDFTCTKGKRTVYEGQTHFGFFSPAALANQAGLTGEKAAPAPASLAFAPYPEGDLWPQGKWRMLDKIALDPIGGRAGLGSAYAVSRVNPAAWFFQAHFYQDPVWPGSLGLEAFIQAAKALAAEKFGADSTRVWAAPTPGTTHEWLYRGQITPDKGEMAINLSVTEVKGDSLTCEGLLMADALPIYKMTGFTVALTDAAPRPGRRRLAGRDPEISPGQLLNWRKEQGLSQGQLARLMGVTPIYISLMERGKRNISPLMIEKLGLIFSGGLTEAEEASDQESEILSKGTLKSRREKKAAAAKLLSSEQLREMRLARGLSQKRLADQVGVTATLIGLIELGKRGLSLELAQKLLAALEGESDDA